MPEVYSMSRWNEPDEWDQKGYAGDRVVHSIKHKKSHKKTKGCPENNHGAHLYAARKVIVEFTDRPTIPKYDTYFTSYCLFCYKGGKSYGGFYGSLRPPASVEVVSTRVRRFGPRVGLGFAYDVETIYDGETDRDGNLI